LNSKDQSASESSTMTLDDIIDAGSVLANVKAKNKKQLLQDLSQLLAKRAGVDGRTIFESLLTREKLGSTGIGQGIAIPHCRIAALGRIYGLFARLASPLEFGSVDGQPVDLVFVLLAPGHAGADHLKALARISRVLRDPAIVAKLRGTSSEEGLFAILTEPAVGSNASAA
jgi:PTS system nitrogen regulatory IIA component